MNMNNDKIALSWAKKYIPEQLNEKVENSHLIANTSYSTVYRIETNLSHYYLKQVPKDLFEEANVYHYLKKLSCENIPIIIGHDEKYHCFLLRSCGEQTFRQIFKYNLDLTLLYQGIEHYTHIQRTVENDIPNLLAQPIQNWRLDKLPTLYKSLIEKRELLLNDGLSEDYLSVLLSLETVVEDTCKEISLYNIPETLNHGDFQDNNMILCKSTKMISIIDWAECTFTHPFFSLNTCLWNLGYFHGIKEGSQQYNDIQKHCIKAWLDLHPEKILLNLMNIVKKIHGIYAALNFYLLYQSTKDQSCSVLNEHPSAIAGCLMTFINANQEKIKRVS